MDLHLNKLISESLKGTYLENIGIGSPMVLVWALNLNPEHFVTMPVEDLSKACFALTKYVAFLQALSNVREATHSYEKRKFNRRMSLIIANYPKGTVAEREARAVEDHQDLQMMEDSLLRAQTDTIMLQKMPEFLLEKVNTIK